MDLIFETLLFSAGPVFLLTGASLGYKTYRKFELLGNISFAVALIFLPQPMLSMMLDTPFDSYHRLLCAFYGAFFVHGVLYTFTLRETTDESVFYGHIWSRIIEAALVIADNTFVYFEGKHWNYKIMCFAVSFALTAIAINFHFLSKIEKPTSTSDNQKLNQLIRFDFFQNFLFGVLMYAFPDHISFVDLSLANESYRSLARGIAANVVAVSFHSLFVAEFKHENDKRSFFIGRLIGNQVELLIAIVGYLMLVSSPVLLWFILLNVGYTLFMYNGYMLTFAEQKSKST